MLVRFGKDQLISTLEVWKIMMLVVALPSIIHGFREKWGVSPIGVTLPFKYYAIFHGTHGIMGESVGITKKLVSVTIPTS